MGLTLVAGAPSSAKRVAAPTSAARQFRIAGVSGCYVRGEYHYRKARSDQRWLDSMRLRIDALHHKVFWREDLQDHPKWQDAKVRLDAMEREWGMREGMVRVHQREASDVHARCVRMWDALTPDERSDMAGAWGMTDQEARPEAVGAWFMRMWDREYDVTAEAVECPF